MLFCQFEQLIKMLNALSLKSSLVYNSYIKKGDPYPFQGQKVKTAEIIVRVAYTNLTSQQYEQLSYKIHHLLTIKSNALINIHTVRQIKATGFILDYQYISQPLNSKSKLNQPNLIAQLKCKIYQFFQELTLIGIKYFPKIQDIGLTKDYEPKIYISPNFQYCPIQSRTELLSQYQKWNEKLFQTIILMKKSSISHSSKTPISEYSLKIDKKLNQLQTRLSMIRTKAKRKSSLSNQKDKANKKGNMVLQYLPEKKTRNYSFYQGLSTLESQSNNSQDDRFHRSSFEDHSTSSQIVHQSSKLIDSQNRASQKSLQKRISDALSKTEQAFKFYEKYKKKKY